MTKTVSVELTEEELEDLIGSLAGVFDEFFCSEADYPESMVLVKRKLEAHLSELRGVEND